MNLMSGKEATGLTVRLAVAFQGTILMEHHIRITRLSRLLRSSFLPTLTFIHDFGGAVMQETVRVVYVVLLVVRVENDREGILEASAEALADFQNVFLSLFGTESLAVLLFRLLLFV